MKTCEIISVGTELLLGDILNTDAQFLATELARLGLCVMHQSTVGDNPDRLLKQISDAAERSDIIILSGGLGPTPDDITKEVACEFFGKELFGFKGFATQKRKTLDIIFVKRLNNFVDGVVCKLFTSIKSPGVRIMTSWAVMRTTLCKETYT